MPYQNQLLKNNKNNFISGNEAVVRGALESGIGFVSAYPGTPASEIADVFAQISLETNLYFEYSVNEKVALEAAAGAAFSGVRSLTAMKQYGLNVALDSLLPLVYLECPLVVVVADDPGCFSSVQTEQDSRWISYLAHIPTLNPSNPQEAKEMTKKAFEIAWHYKTPVLIRLTTRISYVKTKVEFEEMQLIKSKGLFLKPEKGFALGANQTVKLHQKTLARNSRIKYEISEKGDLNFEEPGKKKIGLIATGVSYQYVKEILEEFLSPLPIFKVGLNYPFPEEKIAQFLKKLKQVLVVEETDPILEREIERIAQEKEIKIKIYGKNLLPQANELGPEDVELALSKITDLEFQPAENYSFKIKEPPARFPLWCPGCPHRETFKAVELALGKNIVFGGDIGCYMLGAYPPCQMLDYVVSMGAGLGVAHGIAQTNSRSLKLDDKNKPVAFIGDSTFFHAGIPALINMVFNKSNILVIVLDNSITAMTGHQPHPGAGENIKGEKIKEVKIAKMVKSLGVDFVQEVNVYNQKESVSAITKAYKQEGVSVIVAKGECILYKNKKIK